MKVLITGAAGFIGRNLSVRLVELGFEVLSFKRSDPESVLRDSVAAADVVVHLAGENRPASPDDFYAVNVGLTRHLCAVIGDVSKELPVIFSSSTQAVLANPYGESKLRAEHEMEALAGRSRNPVAVCRLPGVFGKWCRPNYNSVVATFCHSVANDLPIFVKDPERVIRLVYIDDVVERFIDWILSPGSGFQFLEVEPEYSIALGDLASKVRSFAEGRVSLETGAVGKGFARALYSTFISYLPPAKFSYEIPAHRDARGIFAEMLKTPDAGQFSYFTAHPGATRGGHYHHSKTEKFLVLQGRARFRFRNILTGDVCSLETCGGEPRIVDTIPGWVHDIQNIGDDELVVMLWANEVFDRQRPDTVAGKV